MYVREPKQHEIMYSSKIALEIDTQTLGVISVGFFLFTALGSFSVHGTYIVFLFTALT